MMLIALIAMMLATLAHHLGLPEAIARVGLKVAKCPKCLSFWIALFVLALSGCNVFIAIGLSLIVAYLSFWFGLLLGWLNRKYDELWQRLQR